jgi:hypothetical protein
MLDLKLYCEKILETVQMILVLRNHEFFLTIKCSTQKKKVNVGKPTIYNHVVRQIFIYYPH